MTSQGGENRDIVSPFAPVSRDFSHARDVIESPVRRVETTISSTDQQSSSTRSGFTPPVPTTPATTTTTASASSTPTLTATAKKLSKSPYVSLRETSNEESELEMYEEFEGKGMRLIELEGLQKALLESVECKVCGGHVVVKERLHLRQGLYTEMHLSCVECSSTVDIPFSQCTPSKALAVNRRSVLATKCVGGNHASLSMFCGMLGLPPPVSRVAYVEHMKEIRTQAIAQAQCSMDAA